MTIHDHTFYNLRWNLPIYRGFYHAPPQALKMALLSHSSLYMTQGPLRTLKALYGALRASQGVI